MDQNGIKPCKLIHIHIPQKFEDLSVWLFGNIADMIFKSPHIASCDFQINFEFLFYKSIQK